MVEAGFTDADNDGMLDGTGVDADGKVTGGTDGYTTPLDGDTSSTADFLELLTTIQCIPDFDGDGIDNATDLDDDNDGILDTEEGTDDLDGDGYPNYLDIDSDGDGCYDTEEAGFTDADRDGTLDGTGFGADGKVTGGTDGYTTPLDLNTDTILDYLDENIFKACDNDEDGVFNHIDEDDDNDGIVDTVEGFGDLDGDGIPNNFDLDTDGDGCFDIYETTSFPHQTYGAYSNESPEGSGMYGPNVDPSNGRPGNEWYGRYSYYGYNQLGASQDASINLLCGDSDGDGYTDLYDLDDDNDGIRDFSEGGGDRDGDGIPNYLDVDQDGDGCLDVYEAGYNNYNPDGTLAGTGFDEWGRVTGGEAYLSSSEIEKEGGLSNWSNYKEADYCKRDTDEDGVVDLQDLDDDNDGILDTDEGDGTTDTDGDGIPDSLDDDSDNDGCLDVVEAGFTDANKDGYVDGSAINTDGTVKDSSGYVAIADINTNGQLDYLEDTYFIGCDKDNDGILNKLDEDDDNDGILDVVELDGCYKLLESLSFGVGPRSSVPYTNYCYEDGTGTNSLCTSPNEAKIQPGEYSIVQNTSEGNISDWISVSDHTGDANGRMFLVNSNNIPGEFYRRTVDVVPYESIVAEIWVINVVKSGSNLGKPDVSFVAETTAGDIISSITTGEIPENETWTKYTLEIPSGFNTQIDLVFVNNSTETTGNDIAIDDITINQVACDTDGDGITNELDDDSDGDGCSDIVEAGFTDANEDNIIDGTGYNANGTVIGSDGYTTPEDSNGNGIPDYKEDIIISNCNFFPDSDDDGITDDIDLDDDNDGILDTEEGDGSVDTDGDLIPDSLDTDSDNDGCPDVGEAGYTESSTKPGELEGTGYDSDGLVTGGTDGYRN